MLQPLQPPPQRCTLPPHTRGSLAPLAVALPAPVPALLWFCAASQPQQRLPYYPAGSPGSWKPEKDRYQSQIIYCHEHKSWKNKGTGAKLLSKQPSSSSSHGRLCSSSAGLWGHTGPPSLELFWGVWGLLGTSSAGYQLVRVPSRASAHPVGSALSPSGVHPSLRDASHHTWGRLQQLFLPVWKEDCTSSSP